MVVLDTHLGSGTSAIAAHHAGVSNFIGIERDDQYFSAAVNRIKQSVLTGEAFNVEIKNMDVKQYKAL